MRGIREGEGSLLRYYVSDDLRYDPVQADDCIITVSARDIIAQKALIKDGWWGFQLITGEGGLSMQYARFTVGGDVAADHSRPGPLVPCEIARLPAS